MASRREITKKYAREYAGAGKVEKGRLLDELVHATGWTRDHARRAIRAANARKGAANQQPRTPRPRKYSYDALIVLQEVWRLSGQPSGKYLAVVMADTLERLVRFRELGKVQPRVTAAVLDELRSMSAATIDRYLKPHKDAAYPVALSGTKPSHILRSSIPTRTSMDTPFTTPGFWELDTFARRAASATVTSPARTLSTILVFSSGATAAGLAMVNRLLQIRTRKQRALPEGLTRDTRTQHTRTAA